jgi:hypothetical protein
MPDITISLSQEEYDDLQAIAEERLESPEVGARYFPISGLSKLSASKTPTSKRL